MFPRRIIGKLYFGMLERQGFRRTGEVEPFHAGEKFGTQKRPLELVARMRGSSRISGSSIII